MSVNSLPSFAQAFSHRSLQNIQHQNNALPPIHMSTKKRHNDEVKEEGDDEDSGGAPPPSSTVPSPLKKRRVTLSGTNPHPLRIDVRPSTNPNTNGNSNPDHNNPTINASTPISPVVMGFTIQRDNPNAMEQVRNMINVKQKQKALIEQRRGSAAGLVSPTVAATPVEERPSAGKTTAATAQGGRSSRRSPNTGVGTRRNNSNNNGGNTQGQQQRAPSPQPTSSLQIHQQQQSAPPPPQQQPSHSLPPPPISFARRRAAQLGSKKKPADILISPRESLSQSHTHLAHPRHDDRFQPSIQSAPPTQNAFFLSGRLPMALPRLPQIGGDGAVRKTAANVPPTPTRLSMMQGVAATQGGSNVGATATGASHTPPTSTRSPPASVPISTSLQSAIAAIPPTPTVLRNPTYTSTPEAKAAFLGPFEVFYDALNDAKQLKTWLGEQLQKSNALVAGLEKERERMKDWVEGEVDRRVAAVRGEIMGEVSSEVGLLRRRVEELEGIVRGLGSAGSGVAEAYTFPPVSAQQQQQEASTSSSSSSSSSSRLRPERPELTRRRSTPGWGHERETPRDAPHSERGSPNPASGFDARRMSISATRLEGPSTSQSSNSGEPSRGMHSPPLGWESQREKERPTLSRQNSSHHERERERGMPISIPRVVVGDWQDERGQVSRESLRERERGGESHKDRERERESHREKEETSVPLTRRSAGSRRNSVVMSPPDEES